MDFNPIPLLTTRHNGQMPIPLPIARPLMISTYIPLPTADIMDLDQALQSKVELVTIMR